MLGTIKQEAQDNTMPEPSIIEIQERKATDKGRKVNMMISESLKCSLVLQCHELFNLVKVPRQNKEQMITSNIDGKSGENNLYDFLNTWVMFGETVPAFGLGISPLGPRILPKPATWKVHWNKSAWWIFPVFNQSPHWKFQWEYIQSFEHLI